LEAGAKGTQFEAGETAEKQAVDVAADEDDTVVLNGDGAFGGRMGQHTGPFQDGI
jgi:hypothetical protein